MSMDAMMKLQFNLKYTAKQFAKDSRKCEKEIKTEKTKAKKAIEKGNHEGARIYAQNAIRKKNEALNYLRLSSRIDAVASRVDNAVKMRNVTKTMQGVVKGMDRALASMKYDEIARVMDKFEQQFENLDVVTDYMDGAMAQSSAMTTPANEVDTLLSEIADEHNLEFDAETGVKKAGDPEVDPLKDCDDLSARLAKLKELK